MKRGDGTSKRATAKDIAKDLGISAMTVSRALNHRPHVNEETRRRVIKASLRLGYTPDHIAKSLVLKKTYTIGVIVPEITHSFFPEAIRGIEEVANSRGYHLILMHSAENAAKERDALLTLESYRVDGILISTAQTVEDYTVYARLLRHGPRIVFFDRCVPGIGATCVSIDDEESAKKITEHLIGHGYRKIAHLCGPRKVSIGKARLRGFKKALKEHNLLFYEELVVESLFHEVGGYEAMNRLLDLREEKRPRAVVAINDPAAFGAMKAIQEHGLQIPKDIAIVGFSDDIRSELMPTPLTTVRQPAHEVGKRAAQQLCSQIEGVSQGAEQIIIKTEQVIRRSCGCSV